MNLLQVRGVSLDNFYFHCLHQGCQRNNPKAANDNKIASLTTSASVLKPV